MQVVQPKNFKLGKYFWDWVEIFEIRAGSLNHDASADATANAGADATADSTDSKKTWIFKSFSRIT